jgi:hypothetical protein
LIDGRVALALMQPPRLGHLTVRARSEPGGVEIDWHSAIDVSDLPAACAPIRRLLEDRLVNGPRKLSTPGLPVGHPHRDELPPTVRHPDDQLRVVELTVRDVSRAEMFFEPTAAERAEGASIAYESRSGREGARFHMHRCAFGVNSPAQARGPLVSFAALAQAILAEIRRRRL